MSDQPDTSHLNLFKRTFHYAAGGWGGYIVLFVLLIEIVVWG